MQKRLQELQKRLLGWWNRFTPKQKTIITSVTAGVILTFAILIKVLTTPQYTVLATSETTKEAAEIKDLLEGEGLTYKVSTDGLQISILEGQEAEANMLLGANNIPTTGYDIANVVDGGFSTTEADKQKKYRVYLEEKMQKDLEANAVIKNAHVQLSIPEDDGTLIAKEEESFASVVLELDGELKQDVAASLARFIATSIGNDTTDNITIIDTEGNLLFTGEDNLSNTGSASTQITVKQQAESLVKQEVKAVLLGTDLYDSIEVASNLSLDFSTYEKTDHTYTPAEDQTQGVLSHEDTYQSDSAGGTSGTPGTDSNDETTYVVQDGETTSESVTEGSKDYLPNESIVNQSIPAGLIKYDGSSISVSAKKLKVYKEDDAKKQGLLVDMTWEEFQSANSTPVKLEVDKDLYSVVAKATGIAEDNITIAAYESPVFVDSEGFSVDPSDIFMIVLIIVILGLLAFVVLKSMKGEKVEVAEEELSVESLLQSTPPVELENIEVEEKSETRKMIEKFVEENPEAAANLLRNWLTEEWR